MARSFIVEDAVREKLKAVVNFMGASGSGKTFSMLLLAKGMMESAYPNLSDDEHWAKICVVDTEHNRSKIYANVEKHGYKFGKFKHINFEPPHDPEGYVYAIKAAKSCPGVDVVIIDSMTHGWKEILQMQQDAGGRYQDWKNIRPQEAAVWKEIFDQNTHHVLTSMRAKQSYALEKSEMEKLEVRKLGLQPVQNDQLEFEYMVNIMFDDKHRAVATKDNTPIFEPLGHFHVTPEHGTALYDWLEKGVDVEAEREKKRTEYVVKIANALAEDELCVKAITDLEGKMKGVKYNDWKINALEKAWNDYLVPLLKAKEQEDKAPKKEKGKEGKEKKA